MFPNKKSLTLILLPQQNCFTAVVSVYKHETYEFSDWMVPVSNFMETDM